MKVKDRLGFISPTVSSTVLAGDVFVDWIRSKKPLEEWVACFNQAKQLAKVGKARVSKDELVKMNEEEGRAKVTLTPGKIQRRGSSRSLKDCFSEYSPQVDSVLLDWTEGSVITGQVMDSVVHTVKAIDKGLSQLSSYVMMGIEELATLETQHGNSIRQVDCLKSLDRDVGQRKVVRDESLLTASTLWESVARLGVRVDQANLLCS